MKRFLIWGIIIGVIGGGAWMFTQQSPSSSGDSVNDPATQSRPESLAETLFSQGKEAVSARLHNPFASKGSTDKTVTSNTAQQQDLTAEAQKIKKYLMDSANLGFPEPLDVSFALIAARNGDTDKLNTVIQTFKEKRRALNNINPPEAAQDVHQESLEIVKKYTNLLEEVATGNTKQEVENWVDSSRSKALREEAQQVIQQIKALEEQHDLNLPQEVLPNTPSPATSTQSSRYETGTGVKKNSYRGFDFLRPPRVAHIGGSDVTAGTTNELLAQHNQQNSCPLNDTKTDQCGGGEISKEGKGECKREVQLAYYSNCNYGNAPNELGEMKSLHPKDPEPRCSAVDHTPACACRPTPTPGCGTVLRLYPPGCNGCCAPLPVSAEQCCGEDAWFWDKETGWVGCAG